MTVPCRLLGVVLALFSAFATAQVDSEFQDDEGYEAMPDVVVYVHAAGGDAIDLYDAPNTPNIHRFMREVAHSFGDVPDEPSVADYRDSWDDFRTAAAQFDGRFPQRSGSKDLHWEFDTFALSAAMAREGYREYFLTLCLPDVERTIESSMAYEHDDDGCPYWTLESNAAPITISVALRPESGPYRSILIGIAAASLVGVGFAFALAALLRRSLLRRLGTPAFIVAGAGASAALLVSFVAFVALLVMARPIDALVLAHDLSEFQQAAAALIPPLLLGIPGVVVMTLALRAPVDVDAVARPAAPGDVVAGMAVPPPTSGAPPPVQRGPGIPTWLDK